MPRSRLRSIVVWGAGGVGWIVAGFLGCTHGGELRCDPSVDKCDETVTTTGGSPTTGATVTTGSGQASTVSTGATTGGTGGANGATGATSVTTGPASGSGGATRDSGATGGSGNGGSKDAGGFGGNPPFGDASRPFKGKVVAYLPGWRGSFSNWANTVPWSRLTHLNIAFAVPSGGTFTFMSNTDATVHDLVSAAHVNGVKVLMAIGGANGGSEQIQALYAPGNVDGFITNLVSYVNASNLDGVDVDVEGNPVDGNYGAFVDKLVGKLRPTGKLVTAALGQWYGDRVPASAYAAFDFINVMSYDHCGNWTPPCEHASMDWANKDLAFFRGKTSADKIILGVPFYGYCWGTGCPAAAMTYSEIVAKWPGAPDWYVNGGLTVSYNTSATIAAKTQLAHGYGGVMLWEIGQDTSDGLLLKTIVGNL